MYTALLVAGTRGVISGLNVPHIDSCRGSVCTDALLSVAQSASVAQHIARLRHVRGIRGTP